jgi:hypothetical protein
MKIRLWLLCFIVFFNDSSSFYNVFYLPRSSTKKSCSICTMLTTYIIIIHIFKQFIFLSWFDFLQCL